MSAVRRACLLLVPLALSSRLAAQEHAHAHGAELGRVRFSTSCSAGAQGHFIRGLALLHSFWFSEADAAFRAAFEADPTCGIALWGLATSHLRNSLAAAPSPAELAAGGEAAQRAQAVGARTDRERGYITAINAYYQDAGARPHLARLAGYRDSLAALSARHPDDPEAAIFHALSLVATASPTDTTFANQRRAAAILNPLFARFPDHPGLAHYIIHANDSPQLAHLGLDAARRYAAIAPAAPHAQHMPSHIFVRLGLWEETVASNQRSYQASAEDVRRTGRTGLTAEGYHAMDYMVHGYLQLGNDSAARRVAEEAAQASFVPLANAGPPMGAWHGRAAMAARVALERSDWQAAAALEILPAPHPLAEGITRFARAIGAARLGDTAAARAELGGIVRVRDSLRTLGDPYWPRVMEIKRQAVEAWLLLGAGDMVGAVREARAAADAEDVLAKHPVTPAEVVPARLLLADMLAQVGRHDEAVAEYRAVLRHEPNRRRAVTALAATGGSR